MIQTNDHQKSKLKLFPERADKVKARVQDRKTMIPTSLGWLRTWQRKLKLFLERADKKGKQVPVLKSQHMLIAKTRLGSFGSCVLWMLTAKEPSPAMAHQEEETWYLSSRLWDYVSDVLHCAYEVLNSFFQQDIQHFHSGRKQLLKPLNLYWNNQQKQKVLDQVGLNVTAMITTRCSLRKKLKDDGLQ